MGPLKCTLNDKLVFASVRRFKLRRHGRRREVWEKNYGLIWFQEGSIRFNYLDWVQLEGEMFLKRAKLFPDVSPATSLPLSQGQREKMLVRFTWIYLDLP